MRHRISRQVERASLRQARSPNAGSYAKRTALRRYMYGGTRIGGSDVDLPFVLTARSGEHLELQALLELFEGFVRSSYPRSEVTRTKSSIKLQFSSFKPSFDIVPMVAVRRRPRHEYLFRADGSRVETSVSTHVRFVKQRTQASKKVRGVVNFNDMVRLFKWWSQLQARGDDVLRGVPSFMLELLCAKAFDEYGVNRSYTQTLEDWFGAMAKMASSRQQVRFDGHGKNRAAKGWLVLDPVNASNNAVPSAWTALQVDRLARWLAEGEATMRRVHRCDRRDDGRGALRELEHLFGSVVRRPSR